MSSAVFSIKCTINNFIQTKLQSKIEKLDENYSKRKEITIEYAAENWIAGAAQRVGQLQLATHVSKYSHPSAKSTSINLPQACLSEKHLVSTNSISKRHDDVFGNAAALDVYAFLKLDINGESILSRILRNDPVLFEAFPGAVEQKKNWFKSFASIVVSKVAPSSSSLTKQVYFPVDDNEYHLLSPLFPTSLAHEVYLKLQDRFSEETVAARKARREGKTHVQGYKDYLNLALQTFGGSKPQNISQLNSKRGGRVYLLASLPPIWSSVKIKPPLKTISIFNRLFARRPEVKELVTKLKNFLHSTDYKNQAIRRKREAYVAAICDELMLFANEMYQLEGGWSAHPDCKLKQEEAIWLDPKRADTDEVWREQRKSIAWQEEIEFSFATWLNGRLQTDKLRFGDDEHREWRREVRKALSNIFWG